MMSKKINEWLNSGSGWLFKTVFGAIILALLMSCASLFGRVSAVEKAQAVEREHRALVESDQEGQIIRLYNEFKDFRKEYKEDMKALREEMR